MGHCLWLSHHCHCPVYPCLRPRTRGEPQGQGKRVPPVCLQVHPVLPCLRRALPQVYLAQRIHHVCHRRNQLLHRRPRCLQPPPTLRALPHRRPVCVQLSHHPGQAGRHRDHRRDRLAPAP